ncbi:MAG: hypothetical protein HQL69_22455, partial [Magnetococcales bacterium]|nr:hypothetical protein [Magnetococcales bacterium]
MSFILDALKKSEQKHGANDQLVVKDPSNKHFVVKGEGRQNSAVMIVGFFVLAALVGISAMFLVSGRANTSDTTTFEDLALATDNITTSMLVDKADAGKNNVSSSSVQVFGNGTVANGVQQLSARVVGIVNGCLIEIKHNGVYQKISLADVTCLNPKSKEKK